MCLRNREDLACKASPPRYRKMNEFHEYYTGLKRASVPTIFIGGNHEASNYLQELHYGGWVAPNMLYLGAAGVVNVAGVRIAGYSGIFDAQDYTKGHFEREPYTKKSLYSVFHTREMQIHQLAHLTPGSVDIFMSHDWPRKIQDHGDLMALLARRPDFEKSIENDCIGSPGGEELLRRLRPRYWVAGHMHRTFGPHSAINKSLAKPFALHGVETGIFPYRDDLIAALSAKGLDLSKAAQDGWTALHCAARLGQHDVVRCLLAQVSAPDARTSLVEAASCGGWRALHHAVLGGHLLVVEELLVADCDVNVPLTASPVGTSDAGHTPLHLAALEGHVAILELLLQCGADPNRFTTALGRSALHLAVERGHVSCIRWLATRTSLALRMDHEGLTPRRQLDVGATGSSLSPRVLTEIRDILDSAERELRHH
ncbi:hypothetical protein P43SY_004548 [Pythium insidiosum]|uniref:Calcineurin-like phosphoesterase domain-containing protein n=1 Tax=Pythium insidiosum TaxID=114742 RepID=A0AAD5M6V5_PYTIN|nr:hypothetical protein P43SY_004548 [Pythium insidiosum]